MTTENNSVSDEELDSLLSASDEDDEFKDVSEGVDIEDILPTLEENNNKEKFSEKTTPKNP